MRWPCAFGGRRRSGERPAPGRRRRGGDATRNIREHPGHVSYCEREQNTAEQTIYQSRHVTHKKKNRRGQKQNEARQNVLLCVSLLLCLSQSVELNAVMCATLACLENLRDQSRRSVSVTATTPAHTTPHVATTRETEKGRAKTRACGLTPRTCPRAQRPAARPSSRWAACRPEGARTRGPPSRHASS